MLPYKRIIICVDQDVDGRGNICPLVLQMFHSFWPSLYKLGFIRQWNSPIIRLVTKSGAKTVAEFKHETDLDKWIKNNDLSKVDVKYIKGLATHGNKYIPDMFKNFTKNTFTHLTDRNTAKSFNLYYSPHERVARKEILATQVDHLTDEEKLKIDKSGKMSCNRYLDLESKTFMQAAMKRTLKGLDGLTPVRRKILTLMIKHNHTKPMKVFQVGGQTAYEMNYHHGDMSMNGAIIKMAQDYLGSNYFPLLKKEGQFGSRNRKGKDHGSPRYIEVALNVDIVKSIINKDDLYILPKVIEDGSEFEPQYYVPTVPLCILEANKSVSYAWTLQNVGRDLKSVYDILKSMALGKKIRKTCIPANTKGYKGTIEIKDKLVIMKGVYNIKGDTITITELPLNLTPVKYAESLMLQTDYFASVDNYSNDHIDIIATLNPGALVKIKNDPKYKNKNDPLFEFLGLEQTITEQLNFINDKDVVEHFDSAFDVVKRCFELNKVKYENRINRELLLLKWIIIREENILTYINNGDNKKVIDKSEVDANKIMQSGKYQPVNTTVINTHSSYTTNELKKRLESVTIDIGFKYLGSIRNCDTYKESLNERNEKLKKYKERYNKLKKMEDEKPFMGSSMYIEELDETYKTLL